MLASKGNLKRSLYIISLIIFCLVDITVTLPQEELDELDEVTNVNDDIYVRVSLGKDNATIDIVDYVDTLSNLTEHFLPDDIDPKSPIFLFMVIVYTLSTLSAMFSNLIVIIMFKLGPSTKTNLSLFLVNLAVADFLMSTFCMPFTFAQALLKKWIFGSIMCPIVLFKQVFTVSLSIYTLVAIGIDRYLAIKDPLKNRIFHNKGKLIMLAVWILSALLASVQLFVAGLEPIEKNETNYMRVYNESFNNTFIVVKCLTENCTIHAEKMNYTKYTRSHDETIYTCNEKWENEANRQRYTLFNFFAVYLIPVFILAYTYTCIGYILKTTNHPGNADLSRDMHYNKSKRKVIKMLIVLVSVFSLCWLPLHIFTVLKDFTKWLDKLPNVLWYFYGAHWLAMANCSFNPIIYGYSSKKFRSDVYTLIFCCQWRNKKELLKNESNRVITSVYFKKLPQNLSEKSMRLINNTLYSNNITPNFNGERRERASTYLHQTIDRETKDYRYIEMSTSANTGKLLSSRTTSQNQMFKL